MQAENATLSELAAELNRADLAIELGQSKRTWGKYRRNIMAEINRRDPIPAELANMTDAELLAELKACGFDGGDGVN